MKKRVLAGLWAFWLAALLPGATGGRQAAGAEAPPSGSALLKYEEPKYLAASIYGPGPDGKKLLFNFKRIATRSGSTLKVQRDYTYPDGKTAARERAVYEGDSLVLYELDELQIGAAGRATIRRPADPRAPGTIEFEYSKEEGGKPKTHTEALTDSALINDMVGPFLASRWDDLRLGQKVKCRYLVVPRMETVGFTFSKEAESSWQGREVLIVKMEATSPILAALVDPLFFTMEKAAPHLVLRYVGRTTPKIRVGNKWKDLDAVTVFDWASAR